MTTLLHRRHALMALSALCLGLASRRAGAANNSGVAIPKLPTFTRDDPARHGLELAEYADRFDTGWTDVYSKAKMTLSTADGQSITREITQMALEGPQGNKSLIRFLAPADIRGVTALVHEQANAPDDNWLYLPSSRRVRRISGANRTASFQGTEFTYEDLSSLSIERYAWTFVRDGDAAGQPVFELDAKPKDPNSGYSRLHVYLHREHFRVERIDYYDLAGRHLKTLTGSNWQHPHERFWRPQKLDMYNQQTHKRTLMDIEPLFLNVALYPKSDGSKRNGLTPEQFTKRALEAG